MGRDFLFQNIPIITAEKRTVKPKNAYEDIAFRVPFEICQIPNLAVKLQSFTYC
jgi:hypothetical protein